MISVGFVRILERFSGSLISKYFANKRIQLFGAGEMGFFREQASARRKNVMETMVAKKIPCVVVSRNLAPTPEMIEVLEKSRVPLFRTSL